MKNKSQNVENNNSHIYLLEPQFDLSCVILSIAQFLNLKKYCQICKLVM